MPWDAGRLIETRFEIGSAAGQRRQQSEKDADWPDRLTAGAGFEWVRVPARQAGGMGLTRERDKQSCKDHLLGTSVLSAIVC